jgi:hypothetical protein
MAARRFISALRFSGVIPAAEGSFIGGTERAHLPSARESWPSLSNAGVATTAFPADFKRD